MAHQCPGDAVQGAPSHQDYQGAAVHRQAGQSLPLDRGLLLGGVLVSRHYCKGGGHSAVGHGYPGVGGGRYGRG